jgi:hypothetical protein
VNTQAVSVCFCSPFSDRIKAAPENSRTADILPFIEKILIFLKTLQEWTQKVHSRVIYYFKFQ